MKIENKLTQEQIQRLSQFQLQSLQILAMPAEALQEALQKEYTENPFMEYHASHASKDSSTDFLQFVAAPDENYVKNFILEQLNPNQFSKAEWALIDYLAGCVDEYGFLQINEDDLLSHLHIPEGLLRRCLDRLRQLEPAGICTTSMAECLKEQLRRSHSLTPPLDAIITDHLDDVAANRLNDIAEALSLSKKELFSLLDTIRALKPHPLKNLSNETSTFILPDVIIHHDEAGLQISLNDSWMGNYSISDYYVRMMNAATDPAIKTYFQHKYYRCYMMLRNIEQRRKTLIAISQAIWAWQTPYFVEGHSLKAMTLKDIAGATGLNTSTVCRAIKNKYVQTPLGTISFKSLFQKGLHKGSRVISQKDITDSLQKAVASEDSSAPLSDADLARYLSDEYNCSISRRVIAKYRALLHIANSYERKL